MATIGSFAIIRDHRGRVLLGLRRDRDLWNLPGGRAEAGETPWQACVREVAEETGLRVTVDRLVGVYAKPHKDEVVFAFLCTREHGKLTLSDETRDLAYFDPGKLPDNLPGKHRQRIMHAGNMDRAPYLTEQGADIV